MPGLDTQRELRHQTAFLKAKMPNTSKCQKRLLPSAPAFLLQNYVTAKSCTTSDPSKIDKAGISLLEPK